MEKMKILAMIWVTCKKEAVKKLRSRLMNRMKIYRGGALVLVKLGFFLIEKDCLMCTGNQFFYFIAPRRHQWLFQSPKQGILWIFFRKEHNFHLVLSGFVSLI